MTRSIRGSLVILMTLVGSTGFAGSDHPATPKVDIPTGLTGFVVARTDSGASYLINLVTLKAEPVRDLKPGVPTDCPIHHRPKVVALVPIHYGMITGRPLTPEQRARFPLADRAIEGGCCVMPEKVALILVCPECR